MNVVKVRKNFLLDKEIIDNAQKILKSKHQNLTEAINLYFKAIVKDESILEQVEKSANKRTGAFIGLLDGKIGSEKWDDMKSGYYQENERF